MCIRLALIYVCICVNLVVVMFKVLVVWFVYSLVREYLEGWMLV